MPIRQNCRQQISGINNYHIFSAAFPYFSGCRFAFHFFILDAISDYAKMKRALSDIKKGPACKGGKSQAQKAN